MSPQKPRPWKKYKENRAGILPPATKRSDYNSRELIKTVCPHCGRMFAGVHEMCIFCKKPTGLIPDRPRFSDSEEIGPGELTDHLNAVLVEHDDDEQGGGDFAAPAIELTGREGAVA